MYLLTVSQLELHSFQIPTTMSDSQSINTSLLEVKISSKNESVCIRHLSNLTLPTIFHAWWASMNIGSKRRIAWSNSGHAPLWHFYLHRRIEETGIPAIITIIYHQVLRNPSENGTGFRRKYLLAKAHIGKLHKLTESEVSKLTNSTFDETALAILKRKGGRGTTMVT